MLHGNFQIIILQNVKKDFYIIIQVKYWDLQSFYNNWPIYCLISSLINFFFCNLLVRVKIKLSKKPFHILKVNERRLILLANIPYYSIIFRNISLNFFQHCTSTISFHSSLHFVFINLINIHDSIKPTNSPAFLKKFDYRAFI